MISVADLLTQPRIPGHYYSSQSYVQGDLEMGLLENRRGDRLLAIPSPLIEAIYSGLLKETGQATGLVLFNCGRWWGKNFYTRFRDEVTDYYEKPLVDMSMAEFLHCLKDCWATYGWGTMAFDQTYHQRGFIILRTTNSAFANSAPSDYQVPACSLEAGVISAFFSQLVGRDLHTVQTTCESLGASANTFIVGTRSRLDPVESMLEQKTSHDAIMTAICA
jgi:uncharacterized protein